MKIVSLKVYEGFLDGLDITFSEGLNVLIGSRGVGKTSIIEMIRFCLGIESYDEEIELRVKNHSLSILGLGKAELTVEIDSEQYLFSRTADSYFSEPQLSSKSPIILSQGEIEKLGLHEKGKIRLIDNFLSDEIPDLSIENLLLSEIKSLSTQIFSQTKEIEEYSLIIENKSALPKSLKFAEEKKLELTGTLVSLEPQQKELTELSDKTAQLSVQNNVFERTIEKNQSWIDTLNYHLKESLKTEDWPDSAGNEDFLKKFRKKIVNISSGITNLANQYQEEISIIEKLRISRREMKDKLDSKASKLRSEIEKIQTGAGEINQEITKIKEELGEQVALRSLIVERKRLLNQKIDERILKLDELDNYRLKRFSVRKEVGEKLNQQLQPEIRIKVFHGGQLGNYESKIIDTLRGSGLQYNSLVSIIAESMSPRELSLAIDEDNYELISESANISLTRAKNLVRYAQTVGVGNILSARIDDGAVFSLMTGKDYFPTENLSTGQKCTVILPILLSNHGKPIIIDQPEDNLDNKFIADTVIKSIVKTSKTNQIICSTHNPNIPVLGEATLVIHLDSDGERGFVQSSAPLDDSKSINAITTIMEGGKEAFEKRAKFYEAL